MQQNCCDSNGFLTSKLYKEARLIKMLIMFSFQFFVNTAQYFSRAKLTAPLQQGQKIESEGGKR